MSKMKLVFFLIFYVILGTTGITLPILLDGFNINDFSIGLVTIVMSTVGYNASERIMHLYGTKDKKDELFGNLIALVIALLVTIYVCVRISAKTTIYVSCGLFALSCLFWWFQNWNNKNLESTSATDTLGGSVEQFNK